MERKTKSVTKVFVRERSNTTSLTLRPEIPLLVYYEQVAARANRMLVASGRRGNVTVQQVMLQRLRSLPGFKRWKEKG